MFREKRPHGRREMQNGKEDCKMRSAGTLIDRVTDRLRHRRVALLWPLLAVTILSLFQACSAPERLEAVPKALEAEATVGGMSGIRYWQKSDLALMEKDGIESVRRELALSGEDAAAEPLPTANFLAISGGGEDGAFGAGLLVGWSATGTRPEFKLVTGISTGALTAPFAFLGSAYDEALTEVYTTITTKDVLRKRNLTAAIFDDALTDNEPLRKTIAKYLTPEMMSAIAREHDRGRILLIGTTNIDARRPVVWNITKIAASQRPGALDLIRDVLVASTAIPAAFPPMMFDVEVNGKRYQEMHVDGGASAQVFVYPPSLRVGEISNQLHIARDRRLFVIRNGRLDPDWADTERQTMSIAGRAVSSLIQNQGFGDLYRIYATTQRDDVDFNLAYIPSFFDVPLNEPFEQKYMKALYKVGFELGREGYPWEKSPPGY